MTAKDLLLTQNLRPSREEEVLNLMRFVDPLLVVTLWWLCYLLRFRWMSGGEEGLEMAFSWSGLILGLLTIYMYSRSGLYRPFRMQPWSVQISELIRAHSLTVLVFVVLVYFLWEKRLSRSVIIFYLAVSLLVQVLVRILLNSYLVRLRRQGLDPMRVFVAGAGEGLEQLIENWRANANYGVEFIGWYKGLQGPAKFGVANYNGTPAEIVKNCHPDLILVGDSRAEGHFVEDFLKDVHNDIIQIHIVPDMPYSMLGLAVENFQGRLVLKLNQPNFPVVDLLLKRLLDIIGAGMGLVILSPLLLALAIGVKLSSPGSVLFGQERIGLNGRRFHMWKFRSMRVTAENESTWTTANDPRRTALGAFLRKTSLDELPQMWNIFVGEMSIVGPRPEQPRYVEEFRSKIPAYMLRHKMKAGLTGWAQINGWRGDTDLHKRIDCDLYYIRNWSIWFDIKIIFLTVFKAIHSRNAY